MKHWNQCHTVAKHCITVLHMNTTKPSSEVQLHTIYHIHVSSVSVASTDKEFAFAVCDTKGISYNSHAILISSHGYVGSTCQSGLAIL